jgi:hypothetical protein
LSAEKYWGLIFFRYLKKREWENSRIKSRSQLEFKALFVWIAKLGAMEVYIGSAMLLPPIPR